MNSLQKRVVSLFQKSDLVNVPEEVPKNGWCNYLTKRFTRWCIEHPKLGKEVTEIFSFLENFSYSEAWQYLKHGLKEQQYCLECNIPITIYNPSTGYLRKFCGNDCARSSPLTVALREETCLKIFGNKSYMATEEGQLARKKTCLNKYKQDHHMKVPSIKARYVDSILSKYGVDNISKSERVKEKKAQTDYKKFGEGVRLFNTKEFKKVAKATNMRIYGFPNAAQSPIVKEKIRNTTMLNFGVDNIFKRVDLVKKWMLEKYGVDSPLKSPEIKAKVVQTSLDRYDVDWVSKSPIIQKRMQDSIRSKHKGVHHTQLKEWQEEQEKINIEKWGVPHYTMTEEYKQVRREAFLEYLLDSDKLGGLVTPMFDASTYTTVDQVYSFKCNKCGNIFEDHMMGKIPRCTVCFPKNRSLAEIEVQTFLESLGIRCIGSDRHLGIELDIYMPDYRLAVEYNGLYWHSHNGGNKPESYHQDKMLICIESGINLVQIWEDSWLDPSKQKIVKSNLRSLLGLNKNIPASKTQVREITKNKARIFFGKNHIDSHINSNCYYGLFFEDRLVSAISIGTRVIGGERFGNTRSLQVNRHTDAIGIKVENGFKKLMSTIKKKFSGESITLRVDACQGYGYDLIEGMEFKRLSKPDYRFLPYYFSHREPKSKYTRSRMTNLLEGYDPLLGVWDNLKNHGYDKIYDAGHFVYTIHCP